MHIMSQMQHQLRSQVRNLAEGKALYNVLTGPGQVLKPLMEDLCKLQQLNGIPVLPTCTSDLFGLRVLV